MFAMMEGPQADVWEQHIGHAPRSMKGRHNALRLASATSGEEGALERQMPVFRQGVTDVLDRLVRRTDKSSDKMNEEKREAKILSFFELRGQVNGRVQKK